jgi:hypothetical protein
MSPWVARAMLQTKGITMIPRKREAGEIIRALASYTGFLTSRPANNAVAHKDAATPGPKLPHLRHPSQDHEARAFPS